ncbi:MAG TPA: LysR family transcriptional regulator [Polyangiaceae bacterium]|nr:LysR family transcriptional regulator [Polyangiaceae bacterium]
MQNEPMYEWGDLRIFLAVARQGSTVAAARTLGVNQTTVARRIAALEAALGVRLFDRRQDGYRLTEAAAALRGQAERIELEVETLTRLVAQQSRGLEGSIRLTAPEGVAYFILTPWLGEFMDLYPDIRIEVIATERFLDLARGEADMAIRSSSTAPTETGIVFRRLAPQPCAVYCSQAYAARHGIPKTAAALNEHVVIGADGALEKKGPFAWLAAAAPRATVRHVCSSFVNIVAAIKAGHGVSTLPRLIAANDPELVECFELPDLGRHFFLITSEALKDLPRMRALHDFIVARAAYMLEGTPRRA